MLTDLEGGLKDKLVPACETINSQRQSLTIFVKEAISVFRPCQQRLRHGPQYSFHLSDVGFGRVRRRCCPGAIEDK